MGIRDVLNKSLAADNVSIYEQKCNMDASRLELDRVNEQLREVKEKVGPQVSSYEQQLRQRREAHKEAKDALAKILDEVKENRSAFDVLAAIDALNYKLEHTNLKSVAEEKLVIKELSQRKKELSYRVREIVAKHGENKGGNKVAAVAFADANVLERELHRLNGERLRAQAEYDAAAKALEDVETKVDEFRGAQKYLEKQAEAIRRKIQRCHNSLNKLYAHKRQTHAELEADKRAARQEKEQKVAEIKQQKQRAIEESKEAEERKMAESSRRVAEDRHRRWLSTEVIGMQWHQGPDFVAKHAEELVMCKQLLEFLDKGNNVAGLASPKTAKDVQLLLSFEKLKVSYDGSAAEVLDRVKFKKDELVKAQEEIQRKRSGAE